MVSAVCLLFSYKVLVSQYHAWFPDAHVIGMLHVDESPNPRSQTRGN